MPAIERITATPYDVPLKGSLKWGKDHVLAHLQHVLIRVALADGTIGIAEATPRPTIYGETQTSVIHIVQQYLSPMLVGNEVSDFASVVSLSTYMELIKGNNTAKGALDMALHHAVCQSIGIPFHQYLKLSQSKIRVSYIVGTGTQEAVEDDVRQAHEAGVRVFKVKIGKAIPEEIETIKQLIAQFPSAEFYVDANQCLSATDGAGILNELVDLGIIHCEEALPTYQIQARHTLRHQTSMPIIADDSAFTLDDLQREIAFDTFDILNIKTPRTGFSISTKMLKLSLAHHKGIMVGSQASSLLGCLYAALFADHHGIENATECSFFLKTDTDLSMAPTISDGWLDCGQVEEAIERLAVRLI